MGCANVCEFLHTLDAHRELVAQEFDTLLGGASQGGCNGKGCNGKSGAPRSRPTTCRACWPSCPRRLPPRWRSGANTRACWRCAKTAACAWCGWCSAPAPGCEEGRVSEDSRLRMADWIEPLLRRESYLALLQERPSVHERLLRLLGAAKWPARYLLQHPGVIDELASQQLLTDRFDAAAVRGRTGSAPRRAALHRRRRRRGAAQPAAPRPPRRGVPHAGARPGRRADGGAGGRRPLGPGRRGAARDRALVLGASEEPPPRRAGVRHHWLRQAGRQGAGLRQRPGHRVRLRRRRTRTRARSTPPSCAS